ncbi:MAG: hypothetical protein V1920_01900, partial [Bacillota bacterium]
MKTPRKDYSQKEYWDERFKIHGHTGTNDPLLYFYDQRYRMWSIIKALKYCGISICNTSRILDI